MIYDLDDYASDLKKADRIYLRILQNALICRVSGQVKNLPPAAIFELKKQALATKAQYIGAAGKRLRQGVAVELLDRLRAAGWDITPAVAVAVAKTLLGRGVNRKMLLNRYATPGRTAAQKADFNCLSDLPESPLYIKALANLDELLLEAARMRSDMSKNYKNSAAYRLLQQAHGHH